MAQTSSGPSYPVFKYWLHKGWKDEPKSTHQLHMLKFAKYFPSPADVSYTSSCFLLWAFHGYLN